MENSNKIAVAIASLIVVIILIGSSFLLTSFGLWVVTHFVPTLVFSWEAALGLWIINTIINAIFQIPTKMIIASGQKN